MSVSAPTEVESASAPSAEEPAVAVRDMYEEKAVSKSVRVLTVLAYLFSVSLAAILLSVYYVFIWKSPELPMAMEADAPVALRNPEPHPQKQVGDDNLILNIIGGSNSTVKDAITQPTAQSTSGALIEENSTTTEFSFHNISTTENTTELTIHHNITNTLSSYIGAPNVTGDI